MIVFHLGLLILDFEPKYPAPSAPSSGVEDVVVFLPLLNPGMIKPGFVLLGSTVAFVAVMTSGSQFSLCLQPKKRRRKSFNPLKIEYKRPSSFAWKCCIFGQKVSKTSKINPSTIKMTKKYQILTRNL